MTSRDRVNKTLHREKVNRPPIFATVTPQIGEKLDRYLGLPNEGLVSSFFANRISYTKALTQLGNDLVCVAVTWPEGFSPKLNDDGSITDEWGITWGKSGFYDEMVAHPLAEINTKKDLDEFSFPDPHAPGRYDYARETIEKYQKEYSIIGEQECTIFELAWYMVGLEKFLIDLITERDYIYELLDRVMEINLSKACRLIELGVDIIWTGDDFGDQKGMMISPDLWRNIFKPRMDHFFQTCKKRNPHIKIAYHSCGAIRPIIPDLIEIGLDILNPIQPMAIGMDAKSLKKDFGDSLCFMGGIDIQHLLPKGKPDDIKKQVHNIITILGDKGGYITAPAHNIQPDTPVENVIAFFEQAKK